MKIVHDQHRLVLEGKKTETILNNRRLGFIWPGVGNPGYILVMGLVEESSLSNDKHPVQFLKEIEEYDKQRFFELLVIWQKRYRCQYIITNCDKKHELLKNSFLKFIRNKQIKKVYLLDSKDFSGFEEAQPLIQELAKDSNIRIPKNTELHNQLSRVTAHDLKSVEGVSVEERFYAVAAFNHLVTSWSYYPWVKPKKKVSEKKVTEGYR